jgi:hypothetical protein
MTKPHSSPMMIRGPQGHLFPVQSIRACATRLGQVLRHITGENRTFISDKGLFNLIQAGVTTFADGPLKGWSFYLCESDDAQITEFLTNIGIPSKQANLPTNQSSNEPIDQFSNISIKQWQQETKLEPTQTQDELMSVSSWSQDANEIPELTDNIAREFDSLFPSASR